LTRSRDCRILLEIGKCSPSVGGSRATSSASRTCHASQGPTHVHRYHPTISYPSLSRSSLSSRTRRRAPPVSRRPKLLAHAAAHLAPPPPCTAPCSRRPASSQPAAAPRPPLLVPSIAAAPPGLCSALAAGFRRRRLAAAALPDRCSEEATMASPCACCSKEAAMTDDARGVGRLRSSTALSPVVDEIARWRGCKGHRTCREASSENLTLGKQL
jgi:hypothetical protein